MCLDRTREIDKEVAAWYVQDDDRMGKQETGYNEYRQYLPPMAPFPEHDECATAPSGVCGELLGASRAFICTGLPKRPSGSSSFRASGAGRPSRPGTLCSMNYSSHGFSTQRSLGRAAGVLAFPGPQPLPDIDANASCRGELHVERADNVTDSGREPGL